MISAADCARVTAPTDSPAYRAIASTRPDVRRLGGITLKRGIGARVSPIAVSPATGPERPSAAASAERSTRCGAFGHSTP